MINPNDLSSLSGLFKQVYSQHIGGLVYGDPRYLLGYIPLGESRWLRMSGSRSRRLTTEQRIAVARDVLEIAGLYPFRRAA